MDAIFDEYDADGDGTVDADEMSTLVREDPQLAFMLFPIWSYSAPKEEDKDRFIRAIFAEKSSFSKDDVRSILTRCSGIRGIASRVKTPHVGDGK